MKSRETIFCELVYIFNNDFGGIKKLNDATVYGYVVSKLYCFSQNKDGTVVCPSFFCHRNQFQWEAGRYIDATIKKYNEGV